MKCVFHTFAPDEEIPVFDHLRDRRLAKYFSREAAAALVCLGRFLADRPVAHETPLYYATGITEREDYGLPLIAASSTNADKTFSPTLFIQRGFADIPPITQFKLLCNMPLCFLSLNYGFCGDNAVVYSSASSLLHQAIFSPAAQVLLGAGKAYADGRVDAGFALVSKDEVSSSAFLTSEQEAVEAFRFWAGEQEP